MPLYAVLGSFTQKRMDKIKEFPENVVEATKVFESYGVKIVHLVFTMGRYDLVSICEAPDDESMNRALLSWGSRGLLRTETLKGFTREQMVQVIKGI